MANLAVRPAAYEAEWTEMLPSRAAARALAASRYAAPDGLRARNRAITSSDAVSGEPDVNGGAGVYSSRSWIISAGGRWTRCETRVSAKSIPAVTPPPLMRLRSTQTRVLVGSAP